MDIEYEIIMAIDEVVMATGKDINESCEDLIKKFHSDYDLIIEYLENEYGVRFF